MCWALVPRFPRGLFQPLPRAALARVDCEWPCTVRVERVGPAALGRRSSPSVAKVDNPVSRGIIYSVSAPLGRLISHFVGD